MAVTIATFTQQYVKKKKKDTRTTYKSKRDTSPLLASKVEGSVIEVKSTTLTESGMYCHL